MSTGTCIAHNKRNDDVDVDGNDDVDDNSNGATGQAMPCFSNLIVGSQHMNKRIHRQNDRREHERLCMPMESSSHHLISFSHSFQC